MVKLILLGEGSLRRALRHYQTHYHEERNHQGKDNVQLLPDEVVLPFLANFLTDDTILR